MVPMPTAPMPEMQATALLAGDVDSFIEDAWATRMHLHRGDRVELTGLLTLPDVDHLVTSAAIRTPSVRLAREGNVLATSCFTTSASLAGRPLTGLVDVRRLLAEFDDGATVVLQGLHRSWPPLTRLVAHLERELGHPGQANAYLTPPGSRGFAVHADSHDVFVVQTHGTKTWEVHEDAGVREVIMEPGTCLYLPMGTRHAAHTMDSASLHVTIGIRPMTWRQVVRRAMGGVLDGLEDVDARLPAGWVDHPDDLAVQVKDRLQAMADALAATESSAVIDDEVQRFLVSRPTSLAGGLVDHLVADDIDDTTRVQRRDGHVIVVRPGQDCVRLLLGDRELTVPAWLQPAIEHVAATPQLCPGDLSPWLDEQSRRVLVRRLVREGLLQVVA